MQKRSIVLNGLAILAGIVAVLFPPLQSRVGRWTERKLQEPIAKLRELPERWAAQGQVAEPETIALRAFEDIRAAAVAAGGDLWLAQDGQWQRLAATGDGNYLMTPKPDVITQALKGISPRQAQLDVVQLHSIILDKLLGLDQDTITRLGNVRYIREACEATALVASGEADIAFLIKPITLDQLRDISLSGDVMPQKSTDFYPKLLSGLAIYALD